jgi:hypothetical protein
MEPTESLVLSLLLLPFLGNKTSFLFHYLICFTLFLSFLFIKYLFRHGISEREIIKLTNLDRSVLQPIFHREYLESICTHRTLIRIFK